MKQFSRRLPVKIAALFLFVVSASLCVLGVVGISIFAEEGCYSTDSPGFYESFFCENVTENYAFEVFDAYMEYSSGEEDADNVSSRYQMDRLNKNFAEENTNFFFILQDSSGKTLLSNYQDTLSYGSNITYHMEGYFAETADSNQFPTFVIHCFVRDPLSADDGYQEALRLFNTAFSMRYTLIALTGFLFLLSSLCFVLLMCGAGRRPGEEEAIVRGLNRLPFDLYAAALVLAASIALSFLFEFGYREFRMNPYEYPSYTYLSALSGVMLSLLATALCTAAFFMTLAARIKAGTLWQNNVLAYLLRFLLRCIRTITSTFRVILCNLPITWKPILGFAAFILLNFFFTFWYRSTWNAVVLLLWLALYAAAFALVCKCAVQLDLLKKGGEKLAQGDLDYKTDTRHLFWEFKSHGDNLNSVSLGMARAVDEQIKSERLKAELITNVSHDIKTPLTSIINYVDLLKKEDLHNETAEGYIKVLDRQSSRLKKLTEDLVEASKASTGNIAVNAQRTNVVELLNQSAGEYEERFEAAMLTPVMTASAPDIPILADGRLLWRVFDNLLNNIVKYSQEGTRVYMNITEKNNLVTVAFKNISRDSLNISTDELMERFVRGDSARTSEGSGLGLSIARSLTELQGGRFDLAVDGDLFKAVIRFDKLLVPPPDAEHPGTGSPAL